MNDARVTEAFVTRVMDDMSGGMVSIMCALGDQLGLFRALAEQGPADSAGLAARTGLDERYLREWLLCLSSAGYLTAEKADEEGRERFVLPPEHAAVLAFEESPFFIAGAARLVPALSMMLDGVTEGFRSGGGLAPEQYPESLYRTMWQMSASWLDSLLLPQWVPAVDGLTKALEDGTRVAHVGSGGGRALVLLAERFPRSRFVGYDRLRLNVERARRAARDAAVADRVEFVEADARESLSGEHGLIMSFDVLHDAPDPGGTLRAVRSALAPDGVFLLLESNGVDRAVENTGSGAALLYGASVLYSVPITRAGEGRSLGMLGLPPGTLRALCEEAGLTSVRPMPSPTPFNALYEVRP